MAVMSLAPETEIIEGTVAIAAVEAVTEIQTDTVMIVGIEATGSDAAVVVAPERAHLSVAVPNRDHDRRSAEAIVAVVVTEAIETEANEVRELTVVALTLTALVA